MKVEKGEEKPGGMLVRLVKQKGKAGRQRVSWRRNGALE